MRMASQGWNNAGKYGTYCELFFFLMKGKRADGELPFRSVRLHAGSGGERRSWSRRLVCMITYRLGGQVV